ncbi:MAG TPA: glycine cleavage system aminomethyltransferase GcvT, partial [Paracoccaceae bacterium]|nr:glycine cleavage system aminomethyltransferase GcvT [Paracoccaceae bacterium]
LVPVDVLGLAPGRQRYAMFTSDSGGILDDFMVANRGDHLFLVVNASRKDNDTTLMRDALSDACDVERMDDRGLLALQGPRAAEVLGSLAPQAREMRFMDVAEVEIAGAPCIVSRSGYTGEDGYEISMPADRAEQLAEALLAHDAVQPVGLGARDSLRLEAGLCLYGNDIDETTTPVEAGLTWAIQKVRRKGGEREGGFPGADTILAQLIHGAPRRRVGLRPEGRAPVRAGATIHQEREDQPVGTVTSGVYGPTVDGPIAMGYVPAAYAEPGTRLFAEVRGKRLPVTVAALPFTRPGYRR